MCSLGYNMLAIESPSQYLNALCTTVRKHTWCDMDLCLGIKNELLCTQGHHCCTSKRAASTIRDMNAPMHIPTAADTAHEKISALWLSRALGDAARHSHAHNEVDRRPYPPLWLCPFVPIFPIYALRLSRNAGRMWLPPTYASVWTCWPTSTTISGTLSSFSLVFAAALR